MLMTLARVLYRFPGTLLPCVPSLNRHINGAPKVYDLQPTTNVSPRFVAAIRDMGMHLISDAVALRRSAPDLREGQNDFNGHHEAAAAILTAAGFICSRLAEAVETASGSAAEEDG